MRAWIALPLLVVPVAVLGVRRTASSPVHASAVALAAPSTGFEIDRTPGEAAREERRVPEDVLRFEPLEPTPRELMVKILLGESDEPVHDAEVFLLERDDYEWYDGGAIDVEAVARAQGRKLECDAEARVHVALPERVAFLCARKGELFGAAQFDAGDAPEDELRLAPAHDCRVRVVSAGGVPLAGLPVVLGRPGDAWWRADTGQDGEVHIPNVEWLVGDNRRDEETWFIAVEEASSSPALHSFAGADPIPRELELRLAPACALTLEMQASDGTPVPLRGTLVLNSVQGHGRSLAVSFGAMLYSSFPLLAGRAQVARVEPGASLVADVELAGGFSISESVRVPDAESTEVTLRLPENALVLLFRAVGALGEPLAERGLEWITWDEEPGWPMPIVMGRKDLRTDELGRGALVIDRADLERTELEPGEEGPPPHRHRAFLRLSEGPAPLASAVLDLDALAPGSVCDLGALRLEPAPLLARGRLLDGDGAPLARASIRLQNVQIVDGEEQCDDLPGVDEQVTGADGRFAFCGTCTGGRLRLRVERDGYALPADAKLSDFDCGASPELEIVLERTGSLRVSVVADARLDTMYTWILHGPDGEKRDNLYQNRSPGELESGFWGLRPGRYRIELVSDYPLDPPLAAFDDVVIQPGARTLDPRLLRVPLHVAGTPAAAAPERAPELPPIRLQVCDSSGQLLNEGLYVTWGCCSWAHTPFHDGAFELRADKAGDRIGLWAPGQRYCEVECPPRDERLVLQPALRASVHVELPAELRRAGVFVFVDLLDLEEDESASWLPDLARFAELDARGEVRFECPAPARMRLGLHAMQLDPSGPQRRAEAPLEDDDEFWIRVEDVPGEQRFEFAPPAAVWAALARDLAQSR